MAFSGEGSSARLCTICLNTVLDDNSRGKAELICGHIFHLDCIGSEFNYKGAMKCPNCRVTENGEWRIAEDEEFDDDDSPLNVVNPRVEIHIYSHHAMDTNSSIAREIQRSQQNNAVSIRVHSNGGSLSTHMNVGQLVGQESPLPIIVPTVHYHQNTVVASPSQGVSDDPISADTLLRAFGRTHNSSSTQESRVERVILQERPNVANVRSSYSHSSYQRNSPSPVVATSMLRQHRRNPNILGATNSRRFEPLLGDQTNVERNPSLELTLTTSSSEGQVALASQEYRHGSDDEDLDDATE
ncbi:hypothetical protein Pfo_026040 [Paulownia fortunei]|nr:hypothetical protein Pfo_026040 [Paulownia fortunei]